LPDSHPTGRRKYLDFLGGKVKSSIVSSGLACILACLVFALPAFSQDQPTQTPYEIHWKTDLPLLGLAGGAALSPVLFNNAIQKSCPCSAEDVNVFDRGATGRRSDKLDKVSTGAVMAAVAWPLAMMYTDASSRRDAVTDAVITGEAVLVNIGLNETIKLGAHRPRPLLYGLAANDPQIQQDDNYRSFYSQHTSVAFAAGISYARTYALRHPHSRRRWMMYAAVAGGGATVATLRVLSGRHFPTDVITGAAAGTGVGLLVPQLHRKDGAGGLSVVPIRGGLALSWRSPLG
jgi:membrane-associated phospholipid phosphatase